MPMYDYECPDHGGFSVICPMADKKDTEPCPVCKKECPNVIGAPNFKWGKGFPPPTELGRIQEALKKPPQFNEAREQEQDEKREL